MALVVNGDGNITGLSVGGLPSGVINSTLLDSSVIPLGVGQTWQDMEASRAFGTTYTNTTGRPIIVYIRWQNSTQYTLFYLNINGNSLSVNRNPMPTGTNYYFGAFFVIPNGDTYSASGGTLSSWYELR